MEREVIITVIYNKACVHQMLWELEDCGEYLDAALFNFEHLLVVTPTIHL